MSRVTRIEVLEALPVDEAGVGADVTPLDVAKRLPLCGRFDSRDVFALSGAARWQADFPDEADEDDGDESPAAEEGSGAPDEDATTAAEDGDDELAGVDPELLAQVQRHLQWLAKRGFVRCSGADEKDGADEEDGADEPERFAVDVAFCRAQSHRGQVYLDAKKLAKARAKTALVMEQVRRSQPKPTFESTPATRPSPLARAANAAPARKPDSELTPTEYFYRHGVFPAQAAGMRAQGDRT